MPKGIARNKETDKRAQSSAKNAQRVKELIARGKAAEAAEKVQHDEDSDECVEFDLMPKPEEPEPSDEPEPVEEEPKKPKVPSSSKEARYFQQMFNEIQELKKHLIQSKKTKRMKKIEEKEREEEENEDSSEPESEDTSPPKLKRQTNKGKMPKKTKKVEKQHAYTFLKF